MTLFPFSDSPRLFAPPAGGRTIHGDFPSPLFLPPKALVPNRLLLLAVILRAGSALAQVAPAPADAGAAPVKLDAFVVADKLDKAREGIVPSLGATSFTISQQQILDIPQGADAPFSGVILRAPGVAQDSASAGDLHVRGEHSNLQYRINNVLLPEGISGFGLELDPRFVNSLQLITGTLPAQYGFRTAGVVDIQTKGATAEPGGSVSLYGGGYGTIRPSFEVAGGNAATSYFIDGSHDRNDIGIENPTASARPVHDHTDQTKLFANVSHVLDESSRVSLMVSGSDSTFQVPNTPGLDPGTSPNGQPWVKGAFDSRALNETQSERNAFGIVTYQKTAGELNYQVSAFARESRVHFTPDPIGDLYFNGVASDVARALRSGGVQADASYEVHAQHTLRFGASWLSEWVTANSTTTVFPVNEQGNVTGSTLTVADNHHLYGSFAGLYAQDEWTLGPAVTVNYGARFDAFASSFDRENQLSPRLNLIYKATDATALHAGYARYFTPPPVEYVSGSTLARFDHTSNASATDQNDSVKAERADYFDVGITRQFGLGFQVGLDGYYKSARQQLDDGLFGQTLILSAFNYARGRVYGIELSTSYTTGAFSTYANLAHSVAEGKDWSSSQFLFDPNEQAYVRRHWIHLDHDQVLSGSGGVAYHWTDPRGDTRLYADALYGGGLRKGATAPDGSSIPNGATVPAYVTFNIGAAKTFKLAGTRAWKLRLDVVNLADKSYVLRDGSGIGVGAAQYGMRRGVFGSVGFAF